MGTMVTGAHIPHTLNTQKKNAQFIAEKLRTNIRNGDLREVGNKEDIYQSVSQLFGQNQTMASVKQIKY